MSHHDDKTLRKILHAAVDALAFSYEGDVDAFLEALVEILDNNQCKALLVAMKASLGQADPDSPRLH